eukprot:scaffold2097_cov403-Prasinococcus_capsulatus_cf.AAC.7
MLRCRRARREYRRAGGGAGPPPRAGAAQACGQEGPGGSLPHRQAWAHIPQPAIARSFRPEAVVSNTVGRMLTLGGRMAPHSTAGRVAVSTHSAPRQVSSSRGSFACARHGAQIRCDACTAATRGNIGRGQAFRKPALVWPSIWAPVTLNITKHSTPRLDLTVTYTKSLPLNLRMASFAVSMNASRAVAMPSRAARAGKDPRPSGKP